MRQGAFRASLNPFGRGRLNLDDAYRIDEPTQHPAPPPRTTPPPHNKPTVPVVRPPRTGRAPVPTSSRRPAARRTTITRRTVTTVRRRRPTAPSAPSYRNVGGAHFRSPDVDRPTGTLRPSAPRVSVVSRRIPL